MSELAINFNLIKVSTEQFAILGEPPSKEEIINVSSRFRFGYNIENKVIVVFFQFTLIKSQNLPFLSIECGCHFQIPEPDWNKLLNKDDNSIVLPKGFAAHLLMLCVGTTRGLLHAKTENTPFNKFYLPLLNVTKMVGKDVVLSLNNEQPQTK